jgi:hypothetical protein
MAYEVTLRSERGEGARVEVVPSDAYAQEGPLTTFFEGRDGRAVLDSWARRTASFRTADIVAVRLVQAGPDVQAPGQRPALSLAL